MSDGGGASFWLYGVVLVAVLGIAAGLLAWVNSRSKAKKTPAEKEEIDRNSREW